MSGPDRMQTILETSRRVEERPFGVLACASVAALFAGLFTAYARLSFPDFPAPANDLGIISRTTILHYSSRRDVAVLALGVLAGLLGAALGWLAWRAIAGVMQRIAGAGASDALRASALSLAPLLLTFLELLQNPVLWRRQLVWAAALIASLGAALALIAGRPGAGMRGIARAHPDALAFVLGTGAVWGLVLHLWVGSRRGGGYRPALLCLGVLAALASWGVLALLAWIGSDAPPLHRYAAAAHALAPSLLLALYPFLYFDRHPLRYLVPISFLWCAWRARRLLRLPSDPEGPMRVLTPYLWRLLLPVVLALIALDPYYRDAPKGRDMLLYAEEGQHLAWANRILHGQPPGKDFFMLYGPLMEYGHALWIKLTTVTTAESRAYFEALSVLGMVAAYGFGRAFFASGVTAVAAALVLMSISLSPRVAFGLLPLAVAFRAADERGPGLIAAGALIALQAFFSQEVAAAAAIALVLYVALDPLARKGFPGALGKLAVGGAAIGMPAALFLLAKGALLATLGNVASYPRYVAAGYANAPFPRPALPPFLSPERLVRAVFTTQSPLLWYLPPVIYLAAIIVAAGADPRRARDSEGARLICLAAFGLLLFRAALGRSGPAKILYVLPPAILCVMAFLERAVTVAFRERSSRLARLLAGGFAFVGLAYLVVPASMGVTDRFIIRFRHLSGPSERGLQLPALSRMARSPADLARVAPLVAAASYATRALAPDEPMLAIPNDAILYFLCDRRNPTRFDLFSQIVTNAHRREVRADLERDPPKLVLYDLAIKRVDDIPDEIQFPQALHFLWDRYELERVLGPFLVLRPADKPAPREASAATPRTWYFGATPWLLAKGPFAAEAKGVDPRVLTRLRIRGRFEGEGLQLDFTASTARGDDARTLAVKGSGAQDLHLDLADRSSWPWSGLVTRIGLAVRGTRVDRAELLSLSLLPRSSDPP